MTGDPNIPTGEITFRASAARSGTLDERYTSLPPEWGVQAVFEGKGRVAKKG